MIKKYISLLEIVPLILKNTNNKSKAFASHVNDVYRFLPRTGNPNLSYSHDAIRIPSYGFIGNHNSECLSVYMGQEQGISDSYDDDDSDEDDNLVTPPFVITIPEYHIPYILELEYLRQSDTIFSDMELTMLQHTSVMILLQYLMSIEYNKDESLHYIRNDLQQKLSDGAIFSNASIHEIDIEETPERVAEIIHNSYKTYSAYATIPISYVETGLIMSTSNAHDSYGHLLADSEVAYHQYTNMYYCLRSAPLYATFVLLEQAFHKNDISYPKYVEYRNVWDKYFCTYICDEGTKLMWSLRPFSMGVHPHYSSTTEQDTLFVQRMMEIAFKTTMTRIAEIVIPRNHIEYTHNVRLIATQPTSILLSYSTMEWE